MLKTYQTSEVRYGNSVACDQSKKVGSPLSKFDCSNLMEQGRKQTSSNSSRIEGSKNGNSVFPKKGKAQSNSYLN